MQPIQTDSKKDLSTAWLVVLLLLPVAMLNYLDRQMLASMKFSVMADIPDIASEANWGWMLGQFKWVYALLSPVGGYVADRYSRRAVISGSLFVWSAVTWATGHVTSYEDLLWMRSLMGISEAFYIPAALALIIDHHSRSTRSKAVGLHQMAIYGGVIIGGCSGFVAEAPGWGWRSAFDLCGVIGIIYSIPLAMMLRDVPSIVTLDAHSQPVHDECPRVFTAIGRLLSNRSFNLLVLYFTLPALAGWVVRDWMPAIFKDRYHIGQGLSGVSATLSWQIAAILGAIAGGWLADRWTKTNLRGRIYTSAIGMVLIIPAIFGVGNAETLFTAVAFLGLFGLGWGFFDSNNMPILSQVVPPRLRATGYGIMNFVSIGCGGLADWWFGRMRDANVPLNLIFSGFAATAVLSVVLILCVKPDPHLSHVD